MKRPIPNRYPTRRVYIEYIYQPTNQPTNHQFESSYPSFLISRNPRQATNLNRTRCLSTLFTTFAACRAHHLSKVRPFGQQDSGLRILRQWIDQVGWCWKLPMDPRLSSENHGFFVFFFGVFKHHGEPLARLTARLACENGNCQYEEQHRKLNCMIFFAVDI